MQEDEKPIKNSRKQYTLPLYLSFALALGFYLGMRISSPVTTNQDLGITVSKSSSKLSDILSYIEHEYVDTVDRARLEEKAIDALLEELDPHSMYIPAAELAEMNEPLEGNFDGIGIEFRIQKDTITVINPIAGGPSEMLGIKAGDRIVKVDTITVAGVGITNRRVMELLRGESGTKVKVEIARANVDKLLTFEITRDKIPIYSVDVAYMITDQIGFIKVSRFARTTYDEFMKAGEELLAQGMTKLILDLRGNGGGYMNSATKMADEFLEKGKMIVYTEGKSRPREEYRASDRNTFVNIPVAVLIDEGSASASEIVAGALQDNDKGTIIGRRSFGKGLVQEPSSWPDGSAIRLTTSRYYTPTGRCIQKPYENGVKQYYQEFKERLQSGELYHKDSLKIDDSLKYTTPKGKVVYGGGGILPDIFVPADTVGRTYLYSDLVYMGIFRQFSFEYADKNRDALNKFNSYKEFKISDQLLNEFLDFARSKNIKIIPAELEESRDLIINTLRANIGMHIWNNEGFYPIVHEKDKVIETALEILNN